MKGCYEALLIHLYITYMHYFPWILAYAAISSKNLTRDHFSLFNDKMRDRPPHRELRLRSYSFQTTLFEHVGTT